MKTRVPERQWPALPLSAWKDTKDTLHMYAQLVGKVRLALSPAEPEWAHVTLYVTSRGLTTTPIPDAGRTFQIDFDFISHELVISTSDGETRTLALKPRTVAAFYAEVIALLRELKMSVVISPLPQEVANPIPFVDDTKHASYDAEAVHRFWQALSRSDSVMKEFRAPYRGRHTPVQFFWGSFDLSYSRFSGLPADPPPKANRLMRVAMDAQEICFGFWPGDDRFPEAAYFAYGYPRPPGVAQAKILPSLAWWNEQTGLFLVRYEDVRTAESPRKALLEFLSSTYEACATLAGWDRARLD